jgi:hypothetical protein
MISVGEGGSQLLEQGAGYTVTELGRLCAVIEHVVQIFDPEARHQQTVESLVIGVLPRQGLITHYNAL